MPIEIVSNAGNSSNNPYPVDAPILNTKIDTIPNSTEKKKFESIRTHESDSESDFSVKSFTQDELITDFDLQCLNSPVPILPKSAPKMLRKVPWAPISISAVAEFSRTIFPTEVAPAADERNQQLLGGLKFWNTGNNYCNI